MIYERRRDGVADNYLSDQEQSVGALLRKHNKLRADSRTTVINPGYRIDYVILGTVSSG